MTWCVYLTHPEVKIDPDVPVPEWGLSDIGRERAGKATFLPFAKEIKQVISSAEVKAVETAQVFSGRMNVFHRVLQFLHENDRSATGFLPPRNLRRQRMLFLPTLLRQFEDGKELLTLRIAS